MTAGSVTTAPSGSAARSSATTRAPSTRAVTRRTLARPPGGPACALTATECNLLRYQSPPGAGMRWYGGGGPLRRGAPLAAGDSLLQGPEAPTTDGRTRAAGDGRHRSPADLWRWGRTPCRGGRPARGTASSARGQGAVQLGQ